MENRYSKSLPTHIKSGFDLLKDHQRQRNKLKNINIDNNFNAPNKAPKQAIWIRKNRYVGSGVQESQIVIDVDDFRIFYIEDTNNTKINIKSKVVKLTLMDCKNIVVMVDKSVFGTIDIIRCKNVKLHINARVNTIQIDLSENIVFYQNIDEVAYAGTTCVDVVVKNNSVKYTLPITMFSEQTFCVVNEDGVQSASLMRPVNQTLAQHVIF